LSKGDQRALLLITEASTPPMRVIELAQQRGLTLHLLRPSDDLAELLPKIQPALLVWNLGTALESAWSIVEQIRARAQLRHIPVLFYHGGLVLQREVRQDIAGAG
jgi:hypothetical protein